MIQITVFDREENRHKLDAPTDMALNLMELCKGYELPVKGTCGGIALCASCHVYVLSEHALPEPTDDELAMLEMTAAPRRVTSRLSCQIGLDESLDGLVVQLPPTQYCPGVRIHPLRQ